jgi:transposase InsO family protein
VAARKLRVERLDREISYSLMDAQIVIEKWRVEYNHDRPHHGVQNRTPNEAFFAFASVLKNQALTV